MSGWHSLYCVTSDAEAVHARLQHLVKELGYAVYNPFGLMPSRTYRETVRLFVAPAHEGWVRVLGEANPALVQALSSTIPVLWCSLASGQAVIRPFWSGQEAALEVWVREARPTLDAVDIAEAAKPGPQLSTPQPMLQGVPLDALPDNIRKMAQGIDTRQAAKMFERLSAEAMKRVGGQPDAGHALLVQQDAPQWESAGGAALARLAERLAWGSGWRTPDFVTVRDAYQIASRRQRNARTAVLPGDEDALAAVPDALAYMPLFAGRDSAP